MLNISLNRGSKSLLVRFGFDKELVEAIKETGCAEWQADKKAWKLWPTESGLTFLLENEFKPDNDKTAHKVCDWLEALVRKQRTRPERQKLAHASEAPIDDYVMKQCHFKDADNNPCLPRAYQWVPVAYAPLNSGNMLLLDDMGIGKTTQSIMVSMRKEYSKNPVLIVCPPSLTGNWVAELQKMFEVEAKIVNKPMDELDPNIRFYIVSYFQLHKVQVKAPWFLIVDEVHNFKDRKTVRYKALEELIEQKKYLMGLSGTPLPNRPGELYPAMHMVEPGFYKWFDFAMTFCDGHQDRMGHWDFKGASNLDVLHDWLYADFAVRREKSQVLKELPPKVRQVISLSPDKKIEAANVLGMFAESARQKVKDKEFIEYFREALSQMGKTIVFGHHREMLDFVQKTCDELGLGWVRIDGSTPGDKRYSIVQKFQTDPNIKVIICSITAASEGLNIQAAECVLFAELFWVPAKIKQAEDRAHRPGVKHSVLCLYLLWGKREHEIHDIILKKDGYAQKVLSGQHLDLSEEDMMKILSRQWGVTAGVVKTK